MARKLFPITIVFATKIDTVTGEALEMKACPGLRCTAAEVKAAAQAPSTVEIICGQCNDSAQWCPDLARLM